MSFKHLFSRALRAAPGRLHMAAHSHHLWPDASFAGQVQCWKDAARLADTKWDKVMGEVWPEAQAQVADELGTGDGSAIVFASNTHDFLIRLAAAAPRAIGGPLRILTTDGEFHSARRQFARWEEEAEATITRVHAEPFDDFSDRFLAAANSGDHDLILVSQILFGSGRMFRGVEELAALARPEGPWVVIDGYHAFMAIPLPLGGGEEERSDEGEGLSRQDRPSPPPPPASGRGSSAFFLGGGYKYAMAGEGMGFMHCPRGYGARPPLTGWFAEFGELTAPPGSNVGYTSDAMRFMGATFDPSALYRFTAIRRMLAAEGLTTAAVNAHVGPLQRRLLDGLDGTVLADAELLNPLADGPRARFLAFRSPRAAAWNAELLRRGCVTDVRGDVLRIGLGLYHDEADVDSFAALARGLS